MRLLTTTPLLLVSFPALGFAQGLISAPQQSADAGPFPSGIDSVQVAVDGDRMALQGRTYLRTGDQWLPSGQLVGTTRAVAADGGRFVNGNRWDSSSGAFRAGIARIQTPTPTGWQVEQVLQPSDLRARLEFGARVAVSGDTVAALAPGWRPVGQTPDDAVGAVYIFRATPGGWVEEALLSPVGGDEFAFPIGEASIALDGDTLVVSGRDAQPGGGFEPAVHVFHRSAGAWSQATALVLPSGAAEGGLGFYLDVQEEVPGAFASIAVHSNNIGRVFAGHGANWQGQDVATGTWRGPVRFAGSVLAVANPVNPGDATGSVLLYQRDSAGSWQPQDQLGPIEPVAVQYFGANLDLDGEWIAVASGGFFGAPVPLDPEVDVFRVVPIGATEYCMGLPNSTGQLARIGSSGSTSIAANELELVAGSVPSGTGLFYYGAVQSQVPFGDGVRCIASSGGVYRLQQRAVSNGLLTCELDFAALPSGGQILPGSTWNFQAWYRDAAAGGSGFNLSTGLELSFQP